MTTRMPGVQAEQILVRSSQNLADSQLLPCIVGALKQVVTDYKLTYNYSNPATITYPLLKAGAVIETANINLHVKNALVRIVASTVGTGMTATVGTNTVAFASGTPFVDVAAGDTIKFALTSGGINSGTYTVKSKTDSKTIILTTNLNRTVAVTEYFTVDRSYSDIVVDNTNITYAASYFTIDSSGLVYSTKPVVSGDLYIDYVALRKDLTGFYNVSNGDQLAVDMDIDPLNPLGFYLGNIMPAASGGRSILAYILAADTTNAFLAAYEDIGTKATAYYVTPISNNSSVLNAAVSHVTTMSLPENSFFRTAFINTTLVTENELVSSSFTVSA